MYLEILEILKINLEIILIILSIYKILYDFLKKKLYQINYN